MPEIPSLLLDTNIILDVALKRAPWSVDGALLLDAIGRGEASGLIAGHAVTTIHYIIEREVGRTKALAAVADMLALLDVVPLDRNDFQRALSIGLSDYDDAVQVAAALKAGVDHLVSRNPRDFRQSAVPIRSPGEILALIGNSSTE
jgi:predicted nucleic acid-binding protein